MKTLWPNPSVDTAGAKKMTGTSASSSKDSLGARAHQQAPMAARQAARLAAPRKLTEQNWPEGTEPLVSILCITYNHEKYIRQCLEGLLSQETTFPVEIIIHDDASRDGTRDILEHYCAQHPRLLKPVFQQENQYSRGKRAFLLAFQHARGEFIATCEGDDYWTLTSKLQRQIEILDENPSCILCGGRVAVCREGLSTPYKIEPAQEPEVLATLGPQEMLMGYWGMRTVSRLARRSIWSEFAEKVKDSGLLSGDYLFMLYCAAASHGNPGAFRCLDEVVGVYRENDGGVWFSKTAAEKQAESLGILRFALDNFDFGKYVNIIEWVLLLNMKNSRKGFSGWLVYVKQYIRFFMKRNLRKIKRLYQQPTKGAVA